MPRNVRNFWIDCEIDGRTSTLSGGPRSKDGGFHMTIKMRNDGSIEKPLTISGYALKDGSLWLNVSNTINGKTNGYRIETKR